MIREKPAVGTKAAPAPLSKYPLFLSAGSANSLSMYSKKLLEWLKGAGEHGANVLPSLTFNLADRANHSLSHTFSATVDSVRGLEQQLEVAASGSGISAVEGTKPVVLVFGGQESNFIGLSEDVYKSSKVFRRHLDSCNDFLVSIGLQSFYPSIFQQEPIQNVVTLHAALFAVQYSSAKSWIDCGLKVDAVVGHSFGQLTALCISGALSLVDALTLVTGRASLMLKHWGPEAGSMIFLQADRPTVSQLLQTLESQSPEHYAEVACFNGPKSHVVVGSSSSIDSLEQHIANTPSLRDAIRTKRLQVTNGFHSKFTEVLLPHLTELAKSLHWNSPNIHLETCDEVESITEPGFGIVANHSVAQCSSRRRSRD